MLRISLSPTLSPTVPTPRAKFRSWSEVVEDLASEGTRYMIARRKQSPYLQIWDKVQEKRFTIPPIRAWENLPEVIKVHDFIIALGSESWPKISPEKILNADLEDDEILIDYDWNSVRVLTLDHCMKSNKGVDKNVNCDLNNLVKNTPPFKWEAIKDWLYEKPFGTKAFTNRLDSLTQIYLALTNEYGDEPTWLKESDRIKLRKLNNLEMKKLKKFVSDDSHVRAIPNKKEMENFLHSLWPKFKLERWVIAMQLNYGTRNHELHHATIMSKDRPEEGIYKGHLYIPGTWRTKSFEHYVWPLYESWIDEFNLIKDFEEMQNELRSRVKMKVVSALDKTKPWKVGNPIDPGVCINNNVLGAWITIRMRNYLPHLMCNVPDASGLPDKSYEKQRITPYDLRHTWAIRMATDSRCTAITDEQAAKAMGHTIEVHRKNYQKWVSKTEARKQYMSQIQFPKG